MRKEWNTIKTLDYEKLPDGSVRAIEDYGHIYHGIPFWVSDYGQNAYSSSRKRAVSSNCKNCGAPLNWSLVKCEYCDTQFQGDTKPLQRADKWAMFYNSEMVNAKDIGKQVVPIKQSFWNNFMNASLLGALAILPRK